MGEGKVLLSNLNPGNVRIEFLASLINLFIWDLNHDRNLAEITPQGAGPNLGIYRNSAVDHFLTTDNEWMFFVDSDIELPPDALDKLLAVASPDEYPVVSGVYVMMLDEGMRPSLFDRIETEVEVDGQMVKKLDMVPRTDLPTDNPITEVDGTGAGCLLIHRSILEAMLSVYGRPVPWFGEMVFDGVVHGEDFTFCIRVRQMGFPIIVNTDVQCGHVKSTMLRPNMLAESHVEIEESLSDVKRSN